MIPKPVDIYHWNKHKRDYDTYEQALNAMYLSQTCDNKIIFHAIMQIRIAEAAIDSEMIRLDEENQEPNI